MRRELPTDSKERDVISVRRKADWRAASLKRMLGIVFVSAVPLAAFSFLWRDIARGISAAALDGSGHYALGQIYDQLIFPEIFGWTNAFFAGMSFPNLYPPLFFWCVSFIHHTSLVSFVTAFKLVLLIPLFLTPAAIWALARVLTDQNEQAARYSAFAVLPLFILGRAFTRSSCGLDILGTVIVGFYTQPLGFVLLLTWLVVYLHPSRNRWRFIIAAVLLALTTLASFFNAITATVFITAALINDLVKWHVAKDVDRRIQARCEFIWHLLSPLVASALTAFWLVPMLSSYEYVVTRPLTPLTQIIKAPLWAWYALASLSVIVWIRRPTTLMWPFVGACMGLAVGLVFSATLAPPWFPLQSFRFLSTLNFLLAVPVGMSLLFLKQSILGVWKGDRSQAEASDYTASNNPLKKTIIVSILGSVGIVLFAVFRSALALPAPLAFYTARNINRISGVLEFAREHRDGRYLVEVPSTELINPINRLDSLALNAYLGGQGNETISIVYREASPNASFFNAELNAFSAYRENFGISSALMDDVDFINQSLAQHLKRLRFIGVRYLVIATPEMKRRLSREPEIGAWHDIGAWSVFELRQEALPQIRVLQYRPALLVSDFTLKLRRRNQYDFVRLAEEQFSDGWFDVLLVRSAERKVDRLRNLEQFGALILDTYDCADEGRAFAQLKEFALTRTLILLSSDAPLFARIKSSITDFPGAVVIERAREELGDWVEEMEPSHGYDSSSIRAAWKAIKFALDKDKVRVPTTEIESETGPNMIDIKTGVMSPEKSVPVLIATTYHPKWVRHDGRQLYATTPFFTLAFISQPTRLSFERTWHDRLALWGSLGTLLTLCFFAGMHSKRKLKRRLPNPLDIERAGQVLTQNVKPNHG